MFNRIRDHLRERRVPRTPSTADKLLDAAHRLKVEIYRCSDGEVELTYELCGSVSLGDDEDGGDTIQAGTGADVRRLAMLVRDFAERKDGAR